MSRPSIRRVFRSAASVLERSTVPVVGLSLLVSCARFGPGTASRTGNGGAAGNVRSTVITPLRLPASVADSVRTEGLPSGALLHTIVNRGAPWRAFVLEVDLRCHAIKAVKGGGLAVGRATTSALLTSLSSDQRAIGAVNADFFQFDPPGVLTNAHIEDGTLLTGPDTRPVVWSTDGHSVAVDTVRVTGALIGRHGTLPLTGWNRPAARTSGIVDARYGAPLDTNVRKRAMQLIPIDGRLGGSPTRPPDRRYLVRAYPGGAGAGTRVARGDTLQLHVATRATVPLVEGDTVTLQIGLISPGARPIRQAVGGRPILVVDSALARDVETEGQASFRDLNPRTALGLDRSGTRLWLAVIDGRQKGSSMGMTLRQTGELLRALGATRAINLDGGGSSALVVRDPANGATRVVNHPSDPTGERPVGNALAVLSTCGR